MGWLLTQYLALQREAAAARLDAASLRVERDRAVDRARQAEIRAADWQHKAQAWEQLADHAHHTVTVYAAALHTRGITPPDVMVEVGAEPVHGFILGSKT